ncbi:6,7-dimethyl-8-ribityllumazine synthase [Oceanomicrobium pacificus]|uniref:6,7-dimethyl-8-ribityllumazine synthase n=1 Tax=Oceanomicrobium pacificus TaxID=2692916 RepID=A0A6B0TTW2_9RHOB|nr:6,7-dimethyl-8-ribityllumazine synthase [Oceanomicrobium pacificus]MXU65235.1 6,7-dimethyl-8-ribityllumazine synthase [Oceanomicrobium pacificus]
MAANETHHVLPRPNGLAPARVLIVRAPYYKDIADQLLAGAQAACDAAGVAHELIDVPGALEVPTTVALADRSGRFDAYVALGCVIRGETTHYETVCNDSSRGLTLLGLQGLCIGNGILTVENRDQAMARAEAHGQNKGGGAADAALHLLAAKRRFAPARPGDRDLPEGSFRMAGTPQNKDMS